MAYCLYSGPAVTAQAGAPWQAGLSPGWASLAQAEHASTVMVAADAIMQGYVLKPVLSVCIERECACADRVLCHVKPHSCCLLKHNCLVSTIAMWHMPADVTLRLLLSERASERWWGTFQRQSTKSACAPGGSTWTVTPSFGPRLRVCTQISYHM